MGIRKASKAVIPTWSAADLSLDVAKVGAGGSATHWPTLTGLPAREGSVVMLTGTPAEIAAQLADRLLADKVI